MCGSTPINIVVTPHPPSQISGEPKMELKNRTYKKS
jgi:hypothetical protein